MINWKWKIFNLNWFNLFWYNSKMDLNIDKMWKMKYKYRGIVYVESGDF